MASSADDSKPYLSHEERTKDSPRDETLHDVQLTSVKLLKKNVRQIRLSPLDEENGITFLPGQWVDVFCPGVPKAGGFTITSSPKSGKNRRSRGGHFLGRARLDLAVQNAPSNPPAAWLWKPEDEIRDTILQVRVGGSFVWPPPGIRPRARKRVLMIGGGVGINPLMSLLTYLTDERQVPPLQSIGLLYGTKTDELDCSDVLFMSKVSKITNTKQKVQVDLTAEIFATPGAASTAPPKASLQFTKPTIRPRRMSRDDVEQALGPDLVRRDETVVYICGPQAMTDEFVDMVKGFQGIRSENVLCEKWW